MKCTYILLCLFGLISCGSTNAISNNIDSPIELNGTFDVAFLNSENIVAYKTFLEFNDKTKKIAGFSGCNRFSGSYSLNGNVLKISGLATTRMLCQGEVNTTEKTLLDALTSIDSVEILDDTLKMFSKNKLIIEAITQTKQSDLTFEYSTLSRGSHNIVSVNNETVRLTKNRKSETLTRSCTKEEWNSLIKTYNEIDRDQISTLEAPSKKFQFDGAPLAKLNISTNGKTYQTPPFDHMNPPEEIAALVKEILSIGQMIE